MPRVLGFKKGNAELVRFGVKCQTVRAPSKTHPAPGDWRMFYSGLRTRQCRPVFYEPVQIAVVSRVILYVEKPHHLVRVLSPRFGDVDPDIFAAADGFRFFQWRAKGAWFPDNKARWIDSPDRDVMGVWLRHEHPAAFEQGRVRLTLIEWAPPVDIADEADYAAAFGEPIDPDGYQHLAEASGWRETERDADLPPDMPADLVGSLGGGGDG